MGKFTLLSVIVLITLLEILDTASADNDNEKIKREVNVSRLKRGTKYDLFSTLVSNGAFIADTWDQPTGFKEVYGAMTGALACLNMVCHPAELINDISENINLVIDAVETASNLTGALMKVLSSLQPIPYYVGAVAKALKVELSLTIAPALRKAVRILKPIRRPLQKIADVTEHIETACNTLKVGAVVVNGVVQLVDAVHGTEIEKDNLLPLANAMNDTCVKLILDLPFGPEWLVQLTNFQKIVNFGRDARDGSVKAVDLSIYDVTTDLILALLGVLKKLRRVGGIAEILQETLNPLKAIEEWVSRLLDQEVCFDIKTFTTFHRIIGGRKRRMVNVLLDKNSRQVQDIFRRERRQLGFVKDALDSVKDALGGLFDDVKEFVKGEEFCFNVKEVLSKPGEIIDFFLDPIEDYLKEKFSPVTDKIDKMIDELLRILDLNLFEEIEELLKNITLALPTIPEFNVVYTVMNETKLFIEATKLKKSLATNCLKAIDEHISFETMLSIPKLKCACIKKCGSEKPGPDGSPVTGPDGSPVITTTTPIPCEDTMNEEHSVNLVDYNGDTLHTLTSCERLVNCIPEICDKFGKPGERCCQSCKSDIGISAHAEGHGYAKSSFDNVIAVACADSATWFSKIGSKRKTCVELAKNSKRMKSYCKKDLKGKEPAGEGSKMKITEGCCSSCAKLMD